MTSPKLPDGAAAADAAAAVLVVSKALQWALWLPPRGLQCTDWHSRLQYHTTRHLVHCLLTLALPVIAHLVLPQGKSAMLRSARPTKKRCKVKSGRGLINRSPSREQTGGD